MPRGDGTGPAGMGPMTGRAAGYCAGYPVPGFMNPGPRMGMGWGRGYAAPGYGFGVGWGRGYAAPGYGFGMGMGRGMGRGRGMGVGMAPPQSTPQLSKDEELKILSEQSQKMKKDLEMMQKRIDESAKKKKQN